MTEQFILTLMDRFDSSKAGELDFDDGTGRLVLRKEAGPGVLQAPPLAFDQKASALGATMASNEGTEKAPAVRLGLPVQANETITSPIVGTYYGAPSPDAPPFVKAGSKVKTGDSLCILEAMKMMNRLEAEFDCEILSVKAANGELVEYGQVLFEVKRL
jgi:acetyl-CoA carboxylase biotin carboxyl carrier protein